MNYRDARLTPVTRVEPVEYVKASPRPKWPACPSSLTRPSQVGTGVLRRRCGHPDWPRRAHSNPCRPSICGKQPSTLHAVSTDWDRTASVGHCASQGKRSTPFCAERDTTAWRRSIASTVRPCARKGPLQRACPPQPEETLRHPLAWRQALRPQLRREPERPQRQSIAAHQLYACCQRRPCTLCYVEALPDERGPWAVAFLERAEARFARGGGPVEQLITDNGSCR